MSNKEQKAYEMNGKIDAVCLISHIDEYCLNLLIFSSFSLLYPLFMYVEQLREHEKAIKQSNFSPSVHLLYISPPLLWIYSAQRKRKRSRRNWLGLLWDKTSRHELKEFVVVVGYNFIQCTNGTWTFAIVIKLIRF
jgi:hypothetical protein